jgi:hypothetical protein
MKEIDSDTRECSIGDPGSDTGDRIPRTNLELSRSGGFDDKSDPAWKVADLVISNSGIVVCLAGLYHQDLIDLSDFFAEYAQRLRDF